jgi:hypothetical protein
MMPDTTLDRWASWSFRLWGLSLGDYRATFYPSRHPVHRTRFIVVPFWMLFLPFAFATYWAFTKLRTGRWFHPWEEARQFASWVGSVGRGIVRHRWALGIGAGAGCGILAILFVIFHWPMFFGPPVGASLQAALAEAAGKPGHRVIFDPVPSRQTWVPTRASADQGMGMRLAVAGWSSRVPIGTRAIRWSCIFDAQHPHHPKVYYRINGRWHAATPESPVAGRRSVATRRAAATGVLLTVYGGPTGQKFRLPAQATGVRLVPASGSVLTQWGLVVSGRTDRLTWNLFSPSGVPTLRGLSKATMSALRRGINGYVRFAWRRDSPIMSRMRRFWSMPNLDLARAIFAADGRALAQIGNLDKALDIALLSSQRPARVYWCHAARGGVFCIFRMNPGRCRWVVWWFDPKGRLVAHGSVRLSGTTHRTKGQIRRRLARLAVPFFRQMPPFFSFYGRFGASRKEPWRVPPAVPSAKPSPKAKPAVERHLKG